MTTKLRQITDTIHETVYISEMEQHLMATPYFYRLHDVYQSSTVYLTYPCNRTKRYEHSYGTMELAGKMFFAAVTNSNAKNSADVHDFFADGENELSKVVDGIYTDRTSFFVEGQRFKDKLRTGNRTTDSFKQMLYKNYNVIRDSALEHLWPNLGVNESENVQKKNLFVYQCLIEAVRVVALFHDVGHPPYSHIIETVIKNLYEEHCQNDGFESENVKELKRALEDYYKESGVIGYLNQVLPTDGKEAFHECVGARIMKLALYGEIYANNESNKVRYDADKTKMFYKIAVSEFAMAIWCESTPYFASLHRLIAGYVDADRLDYIMRDTVNSGTMWGKIPYKRLVDSIILIKTGAENYPYAIAFPQKMMDDIADVLVVRYKLYARVNFHHRSIKTSLLLQKIVRNLAENMLFEDAADTPCYCEKISDLWKCIDLTDPERTLQIIQWNDSVIIAHLYETLVYVEQNCQEDMSENLSTLKGMLEEFLLNRKHYFSVYKRQFEIVDLIKESVEPFKGILGQIQHEECERVKNSGPYNEKCTPDSVLDSIKRLENLQEDIRNGDADAIEAFLIVNPDELQKEYPNLAKMLCDNMNRDGRPGILGACVQDSLEQAKKDRKIRDYLFDDTSSARKKTGLPGTDQSDDDAPYIYLFDPVDNTIIKSNGANVERQINELASNFLWLCAYIEPMDSDRCEQTIADIRKEVQKRYRTYLRTAVRKLWPHLSTEVDTAHVLEKSWMTE